MTRGATSVSPLRFAQSISMQSILPRSSNEQMRVWDLCALSDEEVLIAAGATGLHALSLRTGQLSAHEPTAIQNAYKVAFDAITNTLLLLVANTDTRANDRSEQCRQLVLLHYNGNEWLEVQRISTQIFLYKIPALAVCESRVLLGTSVVDMFTLKCDTLYVFNVSVQHKYVH